MFMADVQGAELDVLEGACAVLQDTEVVMLKVSLFKTMTTNPEIQDVVAYMKKIEFVVYDIFRYISSLRSRT